MGRFADHNPHNGGSKEHVLVSMCGWFVPNNVLPFFHCIQISVGSSVTFDDLLVATFVLASSLVH